MANIKAPPPPPVFCGLPAVQYHWLAPFSIDFKIDSLPRQTVLLLGRLVILSAFHDPLDGTYTYIQHCIAKSVHLRLAGERLNLPMVVIKF